MKKVILIYGLIAGSIVAAMMFITMPMYNSGTLNLDNGELVGYTTMIIALTMVFFGIKSYRDNYSKGVISFGKGFKVGILITLVACAMYGLAWEVTYSRIGEEFQTKMTEKYMADMKAKGSTDKEIQEAKVQWASFNELYKNFFFRFGFTALVEMFIPVGLPITLLSAAILRRKDFLPSTETA
jgi:hypothetical protein